MAARERDEILGGRPSIGLWPEALEDAGGRHPVHRVNRVGAPGAEDRLVGHAGDVVGGEGEVGDRTDLVVVEPGRPVVLTFQVTDLDGVVLSSGSLGYLIRPTAPEEPEITTPSKPRSLKVVKRTRTSVKISWRAPPTNGGSKITAY